MLSFRRKRQKFIVHEKLNFSSSDHKKPTLCDVRLCLIINTLIECLLYSDLSIFLNSAKNGYSSYLFYTKNYPSAYLSSAMVLSLAVIWVRHSR